MKKGKLKIINQMRKQIQRIGSSTNTSKLDGQIQYNSDIM